MTLYGLVGMGGLGPAPLHRPERGDGLSSSPPSTTERQRRPSSPHPVPRMGPHNPPSSIWWHLKQELAEASAADACFGVKLAFFCY